MPLNHQNPQGNLDVDVDKPCLCARAKVLPFSGWFIEWMASSTDRFWWRVCSPQHHARGSFWSDQADLHQPDQKGSAPAMPCKSRMRLSMPSWSGICGPNRDFLVLKWWSYQHIWLQPALTIELSPYWKFLLKMGCTTRSFTESLVQLEEA